MGAAKVALVAAALAAAGTAARADECTGVGRHGERFATCFDLGNRLSVTAGSDGVGGGIALRHTIRFEDDPDLEWTLEHALLTATYAVLEPRLTGTFYRGRYLRRARDGHLLLPLGGGPPRKIFLPFDIGALFEIGELDLRSTAPRFTVGVVRAAPLIELARARDHRGVLAIGPATHWDMAIDRRFERATLHTIAPFTAGVAMLHLESRAGRVALDLRGEAGTAWHSDTGWAPEARGAASLEWIAVAVNDRPIALTAGIDYDSERHETLARLGARVVLLGRTDPRVSLHPPRHRAR